MTDLETFLVQTRLDSRVCKHLFLRGNFKTDMFFDKVDMINAWNRIWLSAADTGTIVVSAEILNDHLHINAILKDETGDSEFMHHLRLSLTQYHNKRYCCHGTLGTRKFGRGLLKDLDDLKDCICYHIRNVLHHRITPDFMNYKYSTAKFVFDLSGINPEDCYTRRTLPENLARAYLPARVNLPYGWLMTKEGMIVPPKEVFRPDIIEALFNTKEEYLAALCIRTRREANDEDEPLVQTRLDSRSADERVATFVHEHCGIAIPTMDSVQRMEAIHLAHNAFPKVSAQSLARIFSVPASTIKYWLKRRD